MMKEKDRPKGIRVTTLGTAAISTGIQGDKDPVVETFKRVEGG